MSSPSSSSSNSPSSSAVASWYCWYSETISLSHHVIPFLILIEFTLLFGSGILVLLVLRDEIVHVGLSLSELHLVHTLASVPMQESLTSKHGGELLSNTLPDLLYSSGVTNKGNSHLKTLWRNITNGSLDIVRNPLNEV